MVVSRTVLKCPLIDLLFSCDFCWFYILSVLGNQSTCFCDEYIVGSVMIMVAFSFYSAIGQSPIFYWTATIDLWE